MAQSPLGWYIWDDVLASTLRLRNYIRFLLFGDFPRLRIRWPGRRPPAMSGRVATGSALLLAAAATALFPAPSVGANGAHPGSREVFSGDVGPYFMRVNTAPFVGTMHFIVYVSEAGGTEPVTDAESQVSGRRAAGDLPPVGPVAGVDSLDGPNWQTVDIPVEETGEWLFMVRVTSSLGESSVEFPLTVGRRGGGVNLGMVGILLVAVVLAGLVALSWGRRRGRERGAGALESGE